eukprot:359937-Chlamydomonas_euryale.AAC.33
MLSACVAAAIRSQLNPWQQSNPPRCGALLQACLDGCRVSGNYSSNLIVCDGAVVEVVRGTVLEGSVGGFGLAAVDAHTKAASGKPLNEEDWPQMDLMAIPSCSRSLRAAARCSGVMAVALKHFGHMSVACRCVQPTVGRKRVLVGAHGACVQHEVDVALQLLKFKSFSIPFKVLDPDSVACALKEWAVWIGCPSHTF